MKNRLDKFYVKFGIKSDRTKNITKHVLLSSIYKGGTVISNFLLVPLTMSYLDTSNYGIWLTLSSFISWFSFFDIGLGNGLRNKFAEAKVTGDISLARGYVSTAYFTIGLVSLVLILFFFGLNFFIDWTKVFNSEPSLQKELSILMPIVFGFFCLQLVANLITSIYAADQHHSMQGKVNFFTQVGSLLLIWIMTKTSESSLMLFGTIFSVFPVLILVGLNFFSFSNHYQVFKPSFGLWKKIYLKEIFGLGFTFFIVQASGIILYSTDNLIISNIFSPAEVVPYNIAYKYFSISSMIMSIVVTPYWSSFTDAFHKNDFKWIKTSMNSLLKMVMFIIILIVFMLLFSSYSYKIWINDKVTIPFSLSLLMSLFFALSNFVTPFTFFLNGSGKVRIQAIQSVFCAIINIPLSLFLALKMNLGVNGVILSTIICFIPSLILAPTQYYKLISRTAKGLWNK